MSGEVLWQLVQGMVLLMGTVLVPGFLLERALVRSRERAVAIFLALVFGPVAVGTLAVCLGFLFGTVVGTALLLIAAAIVIVVSLTALQHERLTSFPHLTRSDIYRGASILLMLLVVAAAHGYIYDVSNPSIHMRCSVGVVRYLLGMSPRCRVTTHLIAALPPPLVIPDDMVMTCPGDPACPFRGELHFPMKTQVGELPSGQFNLAYSGDGQAGYPVLIAPFLITLRFMGFHVFLILTRILCSLGIYVLLHRIVGGHGIPLLIGAVVMLNPVALSMITFNENLAGLVLGIAAFLLLLDDGPDDGRRTLAAGLVLGSLLGVRHVAATSAPAAVIYLAVSRNRGRRGPLLMLLLIGVVATLLPYLYWHRFVFGDIIGNELAYRNPLYDYVLPLLGVPFRSRLLLNWPFHDAIVRPATLPFPTPVLLTLTFLGIFGMALTAVGFLGVVVLARDRPSLSLFLVLWFLPSIVLMGLVTDWSYEKCTFVYLVILAPAVWIGTGLDHLVHRMDTRELASIVVTTIAIMSFVQWMGSMDVPADDRYSKDDVEEDTLALRRKAWTSVPLLHGGFRPSAAFVAEFPFWSGSRVFRWRDVLDYNHDRSSFPPCSAYIGPLPGLVDSTHAWLPLDHEGRPFIREYVVNAAHIADLSPPTVPYLPFNELHFQGRLNIPLSPPSLILVRDPGGQDEDYLKSRLAQLLAQSPSTPVLILPGIANAQSSKIPDILTDMAPVRQFEGKIEDGSFPLADDVLSRPGAISGRLIPELMVGAEIIWRYEDGTPLLVHRPVDGRNTWFLNLTLSDSP